MNRRKTLLNLVSFIAILSFPLSAQRTALVEGKTALVFELNRGGTSGHYTNVVQRLEKKGELGLRFAVMHLPCMGFLEVYPSRPIYEPVFTPQCNKGAFDIPWPTNSEAVKLPSAWRNYLLIVFPNRAFDVRPLWDNGRKKVTFGPEGPFDKFLFLALTDLKSAEQQFDQLTASFVAPLPKSKVNSSTPQEQEKTHASVTALRNSIMFESRSGTDASLKLLGPTRQGIDIPDGQSATIRVLAGEYFLLARYGKNSDEYVYSEAGPFNITQTETQHSAAKIILRKPPNDNADARREFEATQVPEAQLVERSPLPGTEELNDKDGLKYVWIPPGAFTMGCSIGDDLCQDYEKPPHQVTISNGFWLGQSPVTQAAYKRVKHTNPSHFIGDQLPVDSVTWDQANDYCKSVRMRLPTEAEWEYAARAGNEAARYGDVDAVAWYSKNSENRTHEVGKKVPNAWKLYDILGNVWEWTADWYGESYYSQSPSQDPRGPVSGQQRVLRGGSWYFGSRIVRVSIRHIFPPNHTEATVGFRCAGEISQH